MLQSLDKKLCLAGPQFPPLSRGEFMLGSKSNNYRMLFIRQVLCYELSMLSC